MTTTTTDKGEQDFKREERYYVIKLSDFHRLNLGQQRAIEGVLKDLTYLRERAGKQSLECLVIESDWPEYEPAWKMIEDRMTGRPTNEGQDGLTDSIVDRIIEDAGIPHRGEYSYALAQAIARHLSSNQATPAGEGVELPIFGTVQTVQGQTAYVLILDREAKIPAYAKLADHATATAEIAKRDAEIEIQRAALKNIRLFAARNRKEDWGLLILGFCAEGGVAGHVLRDGEA